MRNGNGLHLQETEKRCYKRLTCDRHYVESYEDSSTINCTLFVLELKVKDPKLRTVNSFFSSYFHHHSKFQTFKELVTMIASLTCT
jgi:hypothetical protein